MPTQKTTQEDLNKIIEFRQTIYEQILTKRRDAQFELLDALLVKGKVASFAWLATAGCFKRAWPSLYEAMEAGEQDESQLRQVLVAQVPTGGLHYWSLDVTGWPRPQAHSLAERQYIYAPGQNLKGQPVVAGYAYSLLDWVPAAGESWSLSVDVVRVRPEHDDLSSGIDQVQRLSQARAGQTGLDLVAADCKYAAPAFLQGVQQTACGKIIRMRQNRVLYGRPEPKPAHCRGRRPKHGSRFAFKEPDTWGEPVEFKQLQDPVWGQVELRRWGTLHGKSAAAIEFDIVQACVHLERDKPPRPLWLLWLPPPLRPPTVQVDVETIWRGYEHRWPIEPGTRFRKQTLNWTLPHFHSSQACDRWSRIVALAFWLLYLARPVVQDAPLPWQPRLTRLTPARVQQGWADIFAQIGCPTRPPQPRGNSPGWPKGKLRRRPDRHKVVKKTPKSLNSAKKAG